MLTDRAGNGMEYGYLVCTAPRLKITQFWTHLLIEALGKGEVAVMGQYGSFYVVGYVVVADRLSVAKYRYLVYCSK